jgi:hypothetical protein
MIVRTDNYRARPDSSESKGSAVEKSSCTFHLQQESLEFPRSLGVIDGCVHRLSTLSSEAGFQYPLDYIRIPSSIEMISKSCFESGTSLWNLAFESGSKISTIGERAFRMCESLE